MSPDLPELVWPAYLRTSASKPLPSRYLDKPPAKLVPLVVEIVKREGPIHIDVIIERLAELSGVSNRDRRLGRIAMGAAYHASQDSLLWESDDDYWLGVRQPARARDHRAVIGRAGEQGYISDREILDGVQKVIGFCPKRSVGEWMEITSRSFGFDELSPGFGTAIVKQIEAANS